MRPKQNNIKNICLAMFSPYYFKPTKIENDYQLDSLVSDTTSVVSLSPALPKRLRFSSSFALSLT